MTTYSLPAVVFDKDIRCTCNGIAAAMGKLGAVVGAYTFYYIAKQASVQVVVGICVLVSTAGAVLTYCCIDDKLLANDDSAPHEVIAEGGSNLNTSSSHDGDEQFIILSPITNIQSKISDQ